MVQLKKVLSGEMKYKPSAPSSYPGQMPEPDIHVITSGGLHIPAHSKILASASPVLENILDRPQKSRTSKRKIPILGVPYDAVSVFIQFLYSSKCNEEQMNKYEIHLLALAHVYLVPQLKQRCTKGLAKRLTVDNVVDVLQLARMCDAPDLRLHCMKLLHRNFKAIELSEGWKFLQDHDPHLELEILEYIDEAESRKKMSRRIKKEQSLYVELSEAMDCLEHICTEGCTSVGPYHNMDWVNHNNKGQCSKFSTCQGIQLLIKHFGTCKKRVNGGCVRCKRMWQLFRLHSSICDHQQHHDDECRVPLCRQFKLKAQQGRRGRDDTRWRLLVRKVLSAKVVSSLSSSILKKEAVLAKCNRGI